MATKKKVVTKTKAKKVYQLITDPTSCQAFIVEKKNSAQVIEILNDLRFYRNNNNASSYLKSLIVDKFDFEGDGIEILSFKFTDFKVLYYD